MIWFLAKVGLRVQRLDTGAQKQGGNQQQQGSTGIDEHHLDGPKQLRVSSVGIFVSQSMI